MNNSFITINTEELEKIVETAVKFDVDRTVEKQLKELKEASDLLNGVLDQVKASYKKQFSDFASKSVEGDLVRVQTYQSGAKYVIADEQVVAPQFLKVQLAPETVEAYEKENNKLPDGIGYKKRAITVKITLKETDHE